MATYEDAMNALRAADAAGNADDARRLAKIAASLKPRGSMLPDMPGLGSILEFFSEKPKERLEGTARSMAQGATFALSDEIEAAARSMGGGSYEDNLKKVRDKVKKFQEENPGVAITSEIVGGIGTGAGMSKLATTIGKAAPRTASVAGKIIPKVARPIAIGAGYGAGYGAGSGEGLEDRAERAGKGAGYGALTAGVIQGTGAGAGAIKRGAAKLVGAKIAPRDAALNYVADKMRADDMTPRKLQARLKDLGPQATIADAGGSNLANTARAAASGPGKARNRISQILDTRAQGETSRLSGSIKKNIAPTDYFSAQDKFIKDLRRNADKLYGEAYKAPNIKSENVNEILSRKPIASAIKEARRIAEASGKRFAVPTDMKDGVPVEAIDDIKRGIDSMMDKPNARNQFGKLNKYGSALNKMKKQLLDEVDNVVPEYAKARAQYGGDAEVLNALEAGKNFMSLSREQIVKEISSLGSEAAKKAYRSGAARKIVDMVESVKDTSSAANRIFGTKSIRDKIRAVMPDGKSYNDLAKTLVSEQRFSQTRNFVGGGSQTQPRAMADKDIQDNLANTAAVVGSNSPFGHALVTSSIARRVMNKITGQMFDKRTAELAKILVSRNQTENLRVIDELLKRFEAAGETKEAARVFEETLAMLAGQQSGLLD